MCKRRIKSQMLATITWFLKMYFLQNSDNFTLQFSQLVYNMNPLSRKFFLAAVALGLFTEALFSCSFIFFIFLVSVMLLRNKLYYYKLYNYIERNIYWSQTPKRKWIPLQMCKLLCLWFLTARLSLSSSLPLLGFLWVIALLCHCTVIITQKQDEGDV